MNKYPGPARHLLVMGGGMNSDYSLGDSSLERVATATEYVKKEYDELRLAHRGLVICVGGYPKDNQNMAIFAGGQTPPGWRGSIASQMSSEVRRRVGDEYDLPVESAAHSSGSSITDIVDAIEEGKLHPYAYSSQNPLGIVTDRTHFKRVAIIAKKAGFHPDAIKGIFSEPRKNVFLVEAAGRALTRLALLNVDRGDLQGMRRADARISRLLAVLRG